MMQSEMCNVCLTFWVLFYSYWTLWY